MKKHIATFCCLMMIQSSVLIAGETGSTAPQSSVRVTHYESGAGPLRRASLSKTPWTAPSPTAWNRRQDQPPAADPDTRSWIERHPVWTGAMIGFAVGSVITYAATASEKKDELFDFSGMQGAAVLLFGGVSAGIGALAGWGIGRSQDDGYHDRARTVEKSSRRSRR
jgi:hypothetical protein